MIRVVCLDFLIEKRSEGRAAVLLNVATGAVGGKTGEEVGDAFVFWAFGGTGGVYNTWEKKLESF